MVHLRRPKSDADFRDDPFWEFGSFGITGCHADNVMNPAKSRELFGARLAFAQGGDDGTRLVFVTPPIHKIVLFENRVEVYWQPTEMPFRYRSAPILVDKKGATDFPRFRQSLMNTDCPTWERKLGSRFRSRRKPLEPNLESELVSVYEERRSSAGKSEIAENYVDALPLERPPLTPKERERRYQERQGQAGPVLSVLDGEGGIIAQKHAGHLQSRRRCFQ